MRKNLLRCRSRRQPTQATTRSRRTAEHLDASRVGVEPFAERRGGREELAECGPTTPSLSRPGDVAPEFERQRLERRAGFPADLAAPGHARRAVDVVRVLDEEQRRCSKRPERRGLSGDQPVREPLRAGARSEKAETTCASTPARSTSPDRRASSSPSPSGRTAGTRLLRSYSPRRRACGHATNFFPAPDHLLEDASTHSATRSTS